MLVTLTCDARSGTLGVVFCILIFQSGLITMVWHYLLSPVIALLLCPKIRINQSSCIIHDCIQLESCKIRRWVWPFLQIVTFLSWIHRFKPNKLTLLCPLRGETVIDMGWQPLICPISLRYLGWERARHSGQPAGFGTLVSTVALQINHHLTTFLIFILLNFGVGTLGKQFAALYNLCTDLHKSSLGNPLRSLLCQLSIHLLSNCETFF